MIIRPRRDVDVPVLETMLIEAQPLTGYPSTWPLGFPVHEFIARRGETHAWVVVIDGQLVGHAGITHPDPGDELTHHWTDDTGVTPDQLGLIGAVFVHHDHLGRGIGGDLLDHAVAAIRTEGWIPVLDVLDEQATAKIIYHNRGWRPVAVAHPAWAPRNTPVTCMVLDDRERR